MKIIKGFIQFDFNFVTFLIGEYKKGNTLYLADLIIRTGALVEQWVHRHHWSSMDAWNPAYKYI